MRATIDTAGRVVIPKSLREAIGLGNGGDVDIQLSDGALIVTPPRIPKRVVDRNGRATIVPDEDVPPLSDAVVRDVLDVIRR